MKKPARLYDEEMTVRALRWRRPRLVAAALAWSGMAVVWAVFGIFWEWLFCASFLCVGFAIGYLLRIVRLNRRLEEIDR